MYYEDMTSFQRYPYPTIRISILYGINIYNGCMFIISPSLEKLEYTCFISGILGFTIDYVRGLHCKIDLVHRQTRPVQA